MINSINYKFLGCHTVKAHLPINADDRVTLDNLFWGSCPGLDSTEWILALLLSGDLLKLANVRQGPPDSGKPSPASRTGAAPSGNCRYIVSCKVQDGKCEWEDEGGVEAMHQAQSDKCRVGLSGTRLARLSLSIFAFVLEHQMQPYHPVSSVLFY
jgi:hypothetical protein